MARKGDWLAVLPLQILIWSEPREGHCGGVERAGSGVTAISASPAYRCGIYTSLGFMGGITARERGDVRHVNAVYYAAYTPLHLPTLDIKSKILIPILEICGLPRGLSFAIV